MLKNCSNNDMPCECCGAGQVLVVLRGPGPAVAARAVDHASASACGTKRVRPLSSTSLADGARLGRPALSGVGAGSATDPLSPGSGLPSSSSCCGRSLLPPLLSASMLSSLSSFSSSSPSLAEDSSSLLMSSALLSSASRDRAALVAVVRHGRHHVKL